MRSFVLIAALMAYAEPPAFEIASIKPSDPDTTVGIRRSGHQIATHGTSLLFLITWAYGIQRDRVYGNPKWLDSVRYDIDANAPDDKSFPSPRMPGQPTALQQMMQQLLADRFKLIIHHDTKERSIYALVVAKGARSRPKCWPRRYPISSAVPCKIALHSRESSISDWSGTRTCSQLVPMMCPRRILALDHRCSPRFPSSLD
ncbi:MAG: TIGR03435 family protein [Acidobacteriaceae bacterium]|nr:TIGR03435 family protein [Acidobacteriaceae bacterium]